MNYGIVCCLIVTALVCVNGELPEEKLDTPGLIAYNGYPSEIHEVTTSDGYILTMHRVPYGRHQSPPSTDKPRPVVFMQHGLECSSSNWVTNLPSQSAAFIFADAGFDVWLGNFRGNTYSKRHVSLSPTSNAFWQFTWDEMSAYDLPAMLNYVLKTTNQPKMHYMGHSMGTMTAFALFSHDQTWVDKIISFHALGPVATVKHIGGLLKYIAPFANDLGWLLDTFGENQFLPNSIIMKVIAKDVCGFFSGGNPLCDDVLFLIAGADSHQLNETRVPVYVAHTPAGTSTMNIQHFGQGVNNGKFEKFDWDTRGGNEKHYGQASPPAYDISQVRVPTYLYWGQLDALADPTDVEYISNTLPISTLMRNNGFSDFNHLDFIWGERAATEVYSKILNVIMNGQ